MLGRPLAQHPPQQRDALAEAVFLDDHARPDRLEHGLPCLNFAGVRHQKEQRLDRLGRQRDRLAGDAIEDPMLCVQPKTFELVSRIPLESLGNGIFSRLHDISAR